ncbi:GNVR domain-containing protein [Paraburkholderia rhynchosiae]|uniref:Sugar transporter n=1 Tax=Paraburkholderia rhynchosiae TaxID=487049 RepID=A0A2N7WNR1_9BURK|nr:GNVR domain-containing protein [Paraburkholderia rhynchosiae]PMS30981.1 sugar transporter [Paraburkholderia rhynchosiae]CAB3704208.1 Putative tyrosine-protein kinase in cps region [Paraburkholderia rhynchosiae]
MNRSSTSFEYKDVDAHPQAGFANYFDALYDNRKLITVTTAVVLAIGIGYAVFAQPVYRADVLVQVEENAGTSNNKNVLGDVSAMFDVKTAPSGEAQVIGSRMVVGRAVNSLNLYIQATPRYFPLFGRWLGRHSDHWSTPGPRGYVWGNESIKVSKFDVPEELYDHPFVLKKGEGQRYEIQYGELELEGMIGEVLSATTHYGPLTLLVQSIDAQPGATFELRRFSELATTEKLRRELSIAEKGKESDIIGVSLEGSDRKQISATLGAIATEYVSQNVKRKSEEAERSIRFLEVQLPELKQQLSDSETRFNDFRTKHGTIDLGEEATNLLQLSVAAQTRRAELEQKRKELLSRFTGQHPAVQSVDAQLRAAQEEATQIASRTALLPPLEQSVLRLQRDVQVGSELDTMLRNTLEQLKLIKAGKVGNVRVVDGAVVPDTPIRPKHLLIVLASLLFGLFAGVVAALVRQRLFDAIDDPYDVELHTGLPVYANVPFSRQEEKLAHSRRPNTRSLVLAAESAADPAIESLRGFRTALEFTMTRARNRVVLISGPTPGIGKSFVALNLAAVIGATGKRVLLIDSDMRRGFLHRHLGGDRGPGLSDLLQGTFGVSEVIRATRFAGVDFIAGGRQVASPSDLLSSGRLEVLLHHLAAGYDVVLFDGPPILSASDALRLAGMAGTTFLVARQGVTGIGELRESARQLQKIGLPVRGVIVNGLRLRPGRYSYGYGRYRYANYIYKPYER